MKGGLYVTLDLLCRSHEWARGVCPQGLVSHRRINYEMGGLILFFVPEANIPVTTPTASNQGRTLPLPVLGVGSI